MSLVEEVAHALADMMILGAGFIDPVTMKRVDPTTVRITLNNSHPNRSSMKTKRLTLNEAIEALKNGMCEAIQSEVDLDDTGKVVLENGLGYVAPTLAWAGTGDPHIPITYLMGTWRMVNPVEILEGFLNVYTDKVAFHPTREAADEANAGRRDCIPFSHILPKEV